MKKRLLTIFLALAVVMGLVGFIKTVSKELFNSDHKQSSQESPASPVDPDQLRKHVLALTSTPLPRDHSHPQVLRDVALYIKASLNKLGLKAEFQDFKAGGKTYQNVIASFGPENSPRIVIGAHYDVAGNQPGADDNASGVAGLLELARLLEARGPELRHRIDLVAYCLEEPPYFGSNEMGSAVHAASLKKENIKVKLMMSLEMIGYFSDEEGSQNFPLAALKYIYPTKGNFIAVVGKLEALGLVRKVKNLMARNSKIDVQFINAPRSLVGIDFSDHRNYWDQGYPAVMITDTAFFRNPNYHTAEDRIETLNFEKMSEVIEGIYHVAVEYE